MLDVCCLMLSSIHSTQPSPTSGPSHLSGHSLSPFLLALPQGLQVLELEQTNRRKRYSIYHPTVLSVSCLLCVMSLSHYLCGETLMVCKKKGALSPITVGEVPVPSHVFLELCRLMPSGFYLTFKFSTRVPLLSTCRLLDAFDSVDCRCM